MPLDVVLISEPRALELLTLDDALKRLSITPPRKSPEDSRAHGLLDPHLNADGRWIPCVDGWHWNS